MSTTVASANGAMVVDLTTDEARVLTNEIKVGIETTWELVEKAYLQRAWLALGYESWDSYCAAEFDSAAIRLPREQRQETVRSLRDAGLSQRAIASAVGVDQGTIRNDLRASEEFSSLADSEPVEGDDEVPVEEPPKITGVNGKTYTSKGPVTPRRHPLPDAYGNAVYKLVRAVESVERLHHDDRFAANRAALAERHRSDMGRARNTLLNILDDLDLDGGKP